MSCLAAPINPAAKMKALSLRSPAALTSAIGAPPPADELQDAIRDSKFWPIGNPDCFPVRWHAACRGWRNGVTQDRCTRNHHGPLSACNSHLFLLGRRRGCRCCSLPAVFCPFPDVAMDVIETPGVRLKGVDRHCAMPILTLGATAYIWGSALPS